MRFAKIVIVGYLAAGCMRGTGSNTDSAETALDSSESVEAEGNVMMAATDGADVTGVVALTPDQVALRIATNVALRWNPSSCATVTQAGSAVTIIYNNCTGPRGLVHVTGALELVVSVSLVGVISIHGTSNELSVNGATLVVDLEATYAVSGTDHALTVVTQGSGTGALGNTIDHTGNYTVTWNTTSMCGSIAGTWSTELTSTAASATRSNVVNLARCTGSCPTGTVVHRFLAGSSLTITFDGTSTASWSASTGKTGTVALACP